MNEVEITPRSPELFAEVLGDTGGRAFVDVLERTRQRLGARTVWHVNSTSAGGGVAEMLQSILAYPRGAAIDVRWAVAEGDDGFFEVTKRIHNLLHGAEGDGGPLAEAERAVYEKALAPEVTELLARVRPDDVVILHDPQTLGLAPGLRAHGARVIWACHVGADEASDETRRAWAFLMPYVRATEAQVFSRPQYRWEGLDPDSAYVIPPCIDAFAPKNQELRSDVVGAILDAAGIVPNGRDGPPPAFRRLDGSGGKVERQAVMLEESSVPGDARIVCQVSRWDPLKDHQGIMEAFVEHVPGDLGAHLVLAGPAPDAVTDDPEGRETLEELRAAWHALPDDRRARVHLACVPMDDLDENAAIINALQRRSDVVVQKSLAEGFGLTVAEAMWKGRPTLGSRVGGIQDQIDDDRNGLLVDPEDPEAFGLAVTALLADPEEAARLGRRGHDRVLEEYLAPTYLARQFGLVERLVRSAA